MSDAISSKERTALIDDLSDARAYHEEEYRWEKQRIGMGGSEIAAGRARRFSDAIAQAALLLSQSPRETSGELEQWKQAVSKMRNTAATCLAVKPTSGMMRHTLEQLAGYDMVKCHHCGAETSWSDVPCESCGQSPVKSGGEPA